MINSKLEVEDVACLVDDMKTTNCSRSFVQRGWIEGENKVLRYLDKAPRIQDTDARDRWKTPYAIFTFFSTSTRIQS
jgi:hypothetical protein